MAAPRRSRSRSRRDTSGPPVVDDTGQGEAPAARRCRACAHDLLTPGDVGWECECGVIVCAEPACIEEYFKFVADGEASRCLSCGLVM